MKYQYDQETGELLAEVDVDYDAAYLTDKKPPDTKENEVAIYTDKNGDVPRTDDGEWRLISDFRGKTIWLDEKPITISKLGDVPAGAVLEKPLSVFKAELRQLINEKKELAVESGLTFEGNTYQTDKDSQARIQGAHTYALSLSEADKAKHQQMWITADNKPVNLTYTQVLALGKAVKEHVEKHIALAATYKQKLMTAATEVDAQAVFDEYAAKLEL